jgi:hypothetical protein
MTRPKRWWDWFRPADRATRPGPRLSRVALDTRPAPPGTDLRWRPGFLSHPLSPPEMAAPEGGQRLGEDASLWHDDQRGGLILRQLPRDETESNLLAPFRLRVEMAGFSGSYLSLSIDLPPEAHRDLLQAHILRLESVLRLDEPPRIWARLNVRHGPNTDEIIREMPLPARGQLGPTVVEFDMAATNINEKRLEKLWLDLIFESPRDGAIEIAELILSRHLRASF